MFSVLARGYLSFCGLSSADHLIKTVVCVQSVLVFALKVPFPSLTFHCDRLGQNDCVIPHKPLPPAPIHASGFSKAQFAERRRFWLCNLVHFHAHHANATAMQHRPHCCCCCSAVVLLARDHLAVLSRRVLSIDKEWCSESQYPPSFFYGWEQVQSSCFTCSL